MKKIIALFFMVFLSHVLMGQIDESQGKMSTIHLKGGSLVDLTIIEWDLDKGVTGLTFWGQEMFIPADKIKKVKAHYLEEAEKYNYVFKEKGVYYALNAGVIVGNNGSRLNEENGYTISFSSGYRLNRLFSIGLGVGVDKYAWDSGERLNPIFLDIRSFLFKNNTSFVANLQAGYSMAFGNDNRGISDAQGGWMFYPNIGLSFGPSYTKYSFDIGYKFQRANWTYSSQWDVRNQTEYNLEYQRLVLRFGVTL